MHGEWAGRYAAPADAEELVCRHTLLQKVASRNYNRTSRPRGCHGWRRGKWRRPGNVLLMPKAGCAAAAHAALASRQHAAV